MLKVGLLRTIGEALYPGTFNRQQENNSVVNNAVFKTLLTQKVSATNHKAPEFMDSDYNAKHFYDVEKMSLEEDK